MSGEAKVNNIYDAYANKSFIDATFPEEDSSLFWPY
jgi:hypothetical protein